MFDISYGEDMHALYIFLILNWDYGEITRLNISNQASIIFPNS